MIVIEKGEYSGLLWNIHDLNKDVDLRLKYSKEFSEIFPHLTKNKYNNSDANRLVRYVIYLYHKASPLRRHIKNIDERRDYASRLAGYDRIVDKAKRDRVLRQEDIIIVQTVISLIKHSDDKRYAQLVTNELMFWEYHKRLMSQLPNQIDKNELELRSKLRSEIKLLQDEIETLEYEVYGGDKEVADLVKEVRKIKTFPEHMAI